MTISEPNFRTINGKTYLVDQHDQPVVYTTRFSARLKSQALSAIGINVAMEPTTEFGSFYHIIKIEEA